MRMTLATIIGLAIVAGAQAQPITPRSTGGHVGQPAPAVEFESLFVLDEEGVPKPIEGSADIAALDRNTLISTETREALEPAIKVWLTKLERLTSENIDLVVKLDTSAFQDFNLKNVENLLFINDSVAMLASAGSLTDSLLEQDAIDDSQAQQNRRIVNDFQKNMIMYNAEKAQKDNPNDMDAQLQVAMTSNYRESLRDVFWVYSKMLASLADHHADIAKTLGERAGQVRIELEAVETAPAGRERIDAVRTLLSKLDYESQHELADLALRLGPISVARDN